MDKDKIDRFFDLAQKAASEDITTNEELELEELGAWIAVAGEDHKEPTASLEQRGYIDSLLNMLGESLEDSGVPSALLTVGEASDLIDDLKELVTEHGSWTDNDGGLRTILVTCSLK